MTNKKFNDAFRKSLSEKKEPVNGGRLKDAVQLNEYSKQFETYEDYVNYMRLSRGMAPVDWTGRRAQKEREEKRKDQNYELERLRAEKEKRDKTLEALEKRNEELQKKIDELHELLRSGVSKAQKQKNENKKQFLQSAQKQLKSIVDKWNKAQDTYKKLLSNDLAKFSAGDPLEDLEIAKYLNVADIRDEKDLKTKYDKIVNLFQERCKDDIEKIFATCSEEETNELKRSVPAAVLTMDKQLSTMLREEHDFIFGDRRKRIRDILYLNEAENPDVKDDAIQAQGSMNTAWNQYQKALKDFKSKKINHSQLAEAEKNYKNAKRLYQQVTNPVSSMNTGASKNKDPLLESKEETTENQISYKKSVMATNTMNLKDATAQTKKTNSTIKSQIDATQDRKERVEAADEDADTTGLSRSIDNKQQQIERNQKKLEQTRMNTEKKNQLLQKQIQQQRQKDNKQEQKLNTEKENPATVNEEVDAAMSGRNVNMKAASIAKSAQSDASKTIAAVSQNGKKAINTATVDETLNEAEYNNKTFSEVNQMLFNGTSGNILKYLINGEINNINKSELKILKYMEGNKDISKELNISIKKIKFALKKSKKGLPYYEYIDLKVEKNKIRNLFTKSQNQYNKRFI